ncbi:pyranose 2-oxidase [Xylaria scruposa]|nr:pyranose 2-oxidase [Xylaria scruposa]
MGGHYQTSTGCKTLESDVLIVGSGPIGAVYARTIADSDKSIRILMVEMGEQQKNNITIQKGMGPYVSQYCSGRIGPVVGICRRSGCFSRTSSLFDVDPASVEQQPYSNLPVAPVVRGVGGMGSYWSCATPEMHPELERPDIFSDNEWKDLYDQAKGLFHTSTSEFDHSIRHDLVKETLMRAHKGREFMNLPLACERSKDNPDYVRWTGPARILGELADPRYNGKNFELKAHTCCRRLLVDTVTRRVVGAELTDLLTNETIMAKAKKYIVCGGATLTAGILFNSGIRQDTGYPALVRSIRQGRYLTEQTMTVCQIVLRNSLLQGIWNDPRCKEHHAKFPKDPLRIPYNDPSPEITTPVSNEFPWHTQIQRDPFHHNTIPTSIDPRLILDIRFFGYVKPVYDNYVEFKSEINDLFGMPQPLIHYRLGKDDAKMAQAMMKDMINVASTLGDFLPGGEPRFLAPGAAMHICGTTRAGKDDDGTSVVDKYSKVWRLENLFLGGCGVIPTQNACNPTLTAACFALVGAKKVVNDLHEVERQDVKTQVRGYSFTSVTHPGAPVYKFLSVLDSIKGSVDSLWRCDGPVLSGGPPFCHRLEHQTERSNQPGAGWCLYNLTLPAKLLPAFLPGLT